MMIEKGNIDLSGDQLELLKEIEELELNCQARQCVEKCEVYLQKYPHCKEVIPSYAHMYHFFDYVKATDIAKQLYNEQPYFYKNTYIYVYLLFDFEFRGRDDIQTIYNNCSSYSGEKDIYFYMTYAITAKQICRYEENIDYLNEAIKIFTHHKMLGRLYHHYAATTGSILAYKTSLELQPRFDYNYFLLGGVQQNLADAVEYMNTGLSINPINYFGLFKLALKYNVNNLDNEAKNTFDRFLSIKIYNPKQIEIYLNWRHNFEKRKEANLRELISIDIIKNSFLYEYLNSSNVNIFGNFIKNINLYSVKNNEIDVARDLILFYMQNNINGYLKIGKKSQLPQFGTLLINESNLTLQSILLLLSYKRHLINEITYQSDYLIWDLYID